METPCLIFIVDDSADYRFIVQRLFNQYLASYSVRFFASGHEVLEELAPLSELPNLILLDRHMPGLDGHSTLLRLKEHPHLKRIPVVMMSAAASSEEVNGCYLAGANSFLHKPADFDLLKDKMIALTHYWLEINRNPIYSPDH